MPWIDERRLPNGLLKPLTKRQLEVVRLAATGIGTTEIAEAMDISFEGARKHVRAIFDLLPNPKRRKPMQLVREWAIEQQLNRQDAES